LSTHTERNDDRLSSDTMMENKKDTKVLNRMRWFWISEAVSKVILLAIAIGCYYGVPPYQRYYAFTELDRRRPVLDATVPEWLAAVILAVFILVMIIIIVVSHIMFAKKMKISRKVAIDQLIIAGLSLFSSVAVCWAVVEPLKRFVAKPRPHFLARCYGNTSYIPELREIPEKLTNYDCYQFNRNNIEWFILTEDEFNSVINEDRLSMPSAHTAITAACLFWMGLYLYRLTGQLRLPSYSALSNAILIGLTVMVAYVATSRIRDLWHDPVDVLMGLLIGVISALWQFSAYFPLHSDGSSSLKYHYEKRWIDLVVPKSDSIEPKVPEVERNNEYYPTSSDER